MNYEILLTFILASAALAISPGPDNIYVLMQSIVNGKKYGIATALGLVSGCLVHTTLLAFGISVLIKENNFIYLGIKIFGALYLLYLAYMVFKSPAEITIGNQKIENKSTGQLYKQGFIMNVLNPKVTIFFLAFFPGFLFSNEMPSIYQFYILGFIFILVSFLVFYFIAVMSSAVSYYIKSHKNIGVILKWLQIVVFIGIAIYLFFSNK